MGYFAIEPDGMKGYTVFNVEQCEGLPAQYTGKAEAPVLSRPQRIEAADRLLLRPVPTCTAGGRLSTRFAVTADGAGPGRRIGGPSPSLLQPFSQRAVNSGVARL
jgi:hypothetical protein